MNIYHVQIGKGKETFHQTIVAVNVDSVKFGDFDELYIMKQVVKDKPQQGGEK